MTKRTAAKILKVLDSRRASNRILHRAGAIHDALAVMSRYPSDVESLICRPHKVHWWGRDYRVRPVLVHKRFGDGRYWGTLSPMNERPDYYIVMGDSAWRDENIFLDALDVDIYPAIEERYGRQSFWCDVCDLCYADEPNECCSEQRQWPALDDEGSTWCFPMYRVQPIQERRWWRQWRRGLLCQ